MPSDIPMRDAQARFFFSLTRRHWFRREEWVVCSFLLAVSSCAPVGDPIGPVETNLEISGTILIDGAPYAGLVRLGIDALNPSWFGATTVFRTESSATGAYEIAGRVNPTFCNRLWLVLDGIFPWYREPVDGCGEHVIQIDASINVRVSGTVTLDGAVFEGADIYFAVEQEDPSGRLLRRVEVDFADAAGGYSFEQRVAPDECDKLWIWWQSHGVDFAERVPACGTHVVDVATTS